MKTASPAEYSFQSYYPRKISISHLMRKHNLFNREINGLELENKLFHILNGNSVVTHVFHYFIVRIYCRHIVPDDKCRRKNTYPEGERRRGNASPAEPTTVIGTDATFHSSTFYYFFQNVNRVTLRSMSCINIDNMERPVFIHQFFYALQIQMIAIVNYCEINLLCHFPYPFGLRFPSLSTDIRTIRALLSEAD